MAKYSRHDPKNKKRNNHKRKSQEGRTPRMRFVETDYKAQDEEKYYFSVHDTGRVGQ